MINDVKCFLQIVPVNNYSVRFKVFKCCGYINMPQTMSENNFDKLPMRMQPRLSPKVVNKIQLLS